MKFLRNLLAAILGSMIGLFLLFFLMFVVLAAVGSMTEKKEVIKKNSVLTLELSSPIQDNPVNNPFAKLEIGPFKQPKTQGLRDILLSIEKAKDDDRIKGIVLEAADVNSNFGGAAFLKEIRKELEEFKESGKFIYAYNKYGYSQRGYWLASVADSVFAHPQGGMALFGFGGEMAFYPKMFEKAGVDPVIIRHGKYKAAVEPYFLTKMSPENREQTMRYLSAMWGDCIGDIAKSRNTTVEALNKITDGVEIRDTKSGKEKGLIDELMHPDEFTAFMKKKLDITDEDDDINYVALSDYKGVKVKSKDGEKVDSKNRVAVIYAEGTIAEDGGITEELAEVIAKVRKNEDIKAAVLRVNSPGGSALISEYILREVKLLKEKMPVVVSFGNVAASGGYYISCAADTILAEPSTITGSIGVFGLFFSGEKLIKEKIGIQTDSFGTNEHSDFMGSQPTPLPLSSRKPTEFERNLIQQSVEDTYDVFISHVAEGRNMTKEAVDEIGQGRVWVGADAKELGLVDVIGGLFDAVQIAKGMANIEGKARIDIYPKEKDPFEKLIKDLSSEAKVAVLKNELGANYKLYKEAKNAMSLQGVQALLPYEVAVE